MKNDGGKRRRLRGYVWLIAALLLGAIAVGCGPERELDVYWPAPAFQLFDQEGRPATLDDYRGTVWLASFVFTSCTDICPAVTAHLIQVQRALDAEGLFEKDVALVSFSVDPARDSPPLLKAYAEARSVDLATWRFLTGPDAELKAVITDGFKLGYQPIPGTDQISHSGRLILVDRDGIIRALHDFRDSSVEEIVSDIKALAG